MALTQLLQDRSIRESSGSACADNQNFGLRIIQEYAQALRRNLPEPFRSPRYGQQARMDAQAAVAGFPVDLDIVIVIAGKQ